MEMTPIILHSIIEHLKATCKSLKKVDSGKMLNSDIYSSVKNSSQLIYDKIFEGISHIMR